MCKLKGAPVPGPSNEKRKNSCTENINDWNLPSYDPSSGAIGRSAYALCITRFIYAVLYENQLIYMIYYN